MRNYTDMRKLYRFEFSVQQIFLLLPPRILCKKIIMIFLQRFHRSSLTYSRGVMGWTLLRQDPTVSINVRVTYRHTVLYSRE